MKAAAVLLAIAVAAGWEWAVALLAGAVLVWWVRDSRVYLVGLATFKAPEEMKLTPEQVVEYCRRTGKFDDKGIEFMQKLLKKSTIGKTAVARAQLADPMELTREMAIVEAEEVLYDIVDRVLKEHGLVPTDIDILVVNCSLFSPTPSLSAMIVNHFKMKSSVHSYSLGGMGCSAGVIALDLARHLLLSHPGSRALVVSTENLSENFYLGRERSMLITNTLFRVGGAAVLLSNRWADRSKALFKLNHVVRTHAGAEDRSFRCVMQRPDDDGVLGISLSKEVMKVAGDALRKNITTIGPLTLPLGEKLKYAVNAVCRSALLGRFPSPLRGPCRRFARALFAAGSHCGCIGSLQKCLRQMALLPAVVDDPTSDKELAGAAYTPDFTKAFDHFCIHAGGRAVLDAIESNLSLPHHKLDASRYVLTNHGNTSSSSIWYELEYHLSHSHVERGQRVWQIAFGSGFKWYVNNSVLMCVVIAPYGRQCIPICGTTSKFTLGQLQKVQLWILLLQTRLPVRRGALLAFCSILTWPVVSDLVLKTPRHH